MFHQMRIIKVYIFCFVFGKLLSEVLNINLGEKNDEIAVYGDYNNGFENFASYEIPPNSSGFAGEDDCDTIDASDLIDVHVVGALNSTEFALGSNLTVECTLNVSSPCASLYGFTESTQLVLMRYNKTVAEGRASRPPRFNFVAHGKDLEFEREETFFCRALDDNEISNLDGEDTVTEVTFNYCARPRLPQTDCEVILGRPYLRCNIIPDDLVIGQASHCSFSSRVTLLISEPLFQSTLSNPQGQCSTRDEGYCEWDLIEQGLKLFCLKVDGENAIGHENSIRPLILSHIILLREQLSPPLIQEVRRSALEAVLQVEWSAPAIDEHLLTMALLEDQPQPHFEFSVRVRCNRTLFPVLHACSSHFDERTINASNASSVEIERVPAGAVYEVEFVARVPPNTRSSAPSIVYYELQVRASAHHWVIFSLLLFGLLLFIIAITTCTIYIVRQKMLIARIHINPTQLPQVKRLFVAKNSMNEMSPYYVGSEQSTEGQYDNDAHFVSQPASQGHESLLQPDVEHNVALVALTPSASSAPVGSLPQREQIDNMNYQTDSSLS